MNSSAVEPSSIVLMYARRKAVRPPKVFKPSFSKVRPSPQNQAGLKQTRSFDASTTTRDKTPRLFDTASSVITNDRYSRVGNATGSQNRVLKSFDVNNPHLPSLSSVFRVRGMLTQISKSVVDKENPNDLLTEDQSMSVSLSMDARHYKKLISSSRKLLQEVWPVAETNFTLQNQQPATEGVAGLQKPSEERLPGFKLVPNLPSSSVSISKKLPKLYCKMLSTKKPVSDHEAAIWTHLNDRRRLEFELKSLLIEPSRNARVVSDEADGPPKSRRTGLPSIKVFPPNLEHLTKTKSGEQSPTLDAKISTSEIGEGSESVVYQRSRSQVSAELTQQFENRTHNSSRSGSDTSKKIKVVKGIVYESYKLPGSDKEHYGIKGFLANGQETSNIMKSVSSSYDNSDFVELDRIEADGMQKDLGEADRMALVDFRNHEKYKSVKGELSSQQRLDSLSKSGIAGWLKSSGSKLLVSPPAADTYSRKNVSSRNQKSGSTLPDDVAGGPSGNNLPDIPPKEKFIQWVVQDEKRRKATQTNYEPQTVQAAVERCETLAEYRSKFQDIMKAFRSKNEQKAAREIERQEIEKDRERTMRLKAWKMLSPSSPRLQKGGNGRIRLQRQATEF